MRSKLIIKTKCPECGSINMIPKFDLDIVFIGSTNKMKGFGYNCFACSNQIVLGTDIVNEKSVKFEGL